MQELLTSHRSIRKFKETPIADELLTELLYAGLRGSSSGNMQTWSVIVTRDPKIKEKLYVAHREQEMVRQAPVVLTFCADVFRMREWIRVNNSKQSFDDLLGFLTGAVDAIISAQNVTLAAEAAGLGICYMGTTWWAANELIALLNLPKYVFPVTSLVVGYPDEAPALRDRLPLDLIVHQEKYIRLNDEEIKARHAEREVNAWNRYTANAELAQRLADNGITKVTDFYTSKFKYSKELHYEISAMLLETLKKQGFWL